MHISLTWLSRHLDLSDLGPGELADLLTFAGIEVEGIQTRGVASDKVVVGQVAQADPHPNADRLKLCQVTTGGGSLHQIVCGASNYKAGDKVPLALPGAVLPGGFEIKRGQIRGVESAGMMCSERELGLSDDHSGILILPEDAPVGAPLREVVPADTVFEVEITPNRPDLLSHFGMARELAALTGRPLQGTMPDDPPTRPARPGEIDLATETCPYYTARIIRGVKVGESPAWLKKRLESIGLRPINNVVDVTNFVLHETGHPLHAFDLGQLADGRIVVRPARAGEEFVALDGATYRLQPADCVIADAARAVALGGVMGGEGSGVTESTTDILLESAWFVPAAVRSTSRRTGLTSDSSYRFERGADPGMVLPASALATRLVVETAGGVADEAVLVAGRAPCLTGTVPYDTRKAGVFLGGHISAEEQLGILTKLGLFHRSGGIFDVPSYRADLQRPIDLIEEVARVHGLAAVPARTSAAPAPASPVDSFYDFVLGLKRELAANGFHEARTLKLIARAQLADAPLAEPRAVPVRNPLSEDHVLMRPSLVPGLLAVAGLNINHGARRLAFFEAGTVFRAGADPAEAVESQALAILWAGSAGDPSWAQPDPRPVLFADLRGIVDRLVPAGTKLRVTATERPGCVLAAEVGLSKKEVIGCIGQILPARARAMGWDQPFFVIELDLAALHDLARTRKPRFEELPRFPAITRDVAVELPADLPASRIDAALGNVREPLLVGWELFDVFADPTGLKLPADRKSLAWSLTYRDPARTLRSEEVDAAHAKVREVLAKMNGVKLR